MLIGRLSRRAQFASVSERGFDKPATGRAIAQRTDDERQLVSGRERVLAPPAPAEIVGAHAFDAPGLDLPVVAGHIDPDPCVRVRPVELLDGAADRLFRLEVERRERVMGGGLASTSCEQRDGDECQRESAHESSSYLSEVPAGSSRRIPALPFSSTKLRLFSWQTYSAIVHDRCRCSVRVVV